MAVSAAIMFLIWTAGVAQLWYWEQQAAQRQSESLDTADTAVILGNAVNRRGKPNPCLKTRVEAGVALYRTGKVSRLLVSGGTDGDGSNQAQAMHDIAVSLGVPRERIIEENRSESTYENITFSAMFLQEGESVIIVSDAFHLKRAEWLAKRHWAVRPLQLYASAGCGDSAPNRLRKLSREMLAWVKALTLHR